MKILPVIAFTAGLTVSLSAAAFDSETAAEEGIFQLSHLADTAQTLGIARTPCFTPRPGWTTCPGENIAEHLIGRHPSDRSVWALMGAEAAAHLAVTVGLERAHAPRWLLRSWEGVTIAVQTADDAKNASIGLAWHL